MRLSLHRMRTHNPGGCTQVVRGAGRNMGISAPVGAGGLSRQEGESQQLRRFALRLAFFWRISIKYGVQGVPGSNPGVPTNFTLYFQRVSPGVPDRQFRAGTFPVLWFRLYDLLHGPAVR